MGHWASRGWAVSPPVSSIEERNGKERGLICSLDSRGGICEKPAKDIYEGQRVMKTLNTGMITVINHNSRTSSLMTELTFAHEVGHNLGAEVCHCSLSIREDRCFSQWHL